MARKTVVIPTNRSPEEVDTIIREILFTDGYHPSVQEGNTLWTERNRRSAAVHYIQIDQSNPSFVTLSGWTEQNGVETDGALPSPIRKIRNELTGNLSYRELEHTAPIKLPQEEEKEIFSSSLDSPEEVAPHFVPGQSSPKQKSITTEQTKVFIPPIPGVEPPKKIIFCMHCGTRLRVDDNGRRLRVTCPKCRGVFEI